MRYKDHQAQCAKCKDLMDRDPIPPDWESTPRLCPEGENIRDIELIKAKLSTLQTAGCILQLFVLILAIFLWWESSLLHELAKRR